MALEHAIAGVPLDVRPLADRLAETPSAALFKSKDLEVMRLVLRAGKSLPVHQVPGEITIQCIEGSLAIPLPASVVTLRAGELLFLAAGTPHGVQAVTDTSALVTIALRS
ncbi:cupin domain-containing protein [Aquabacterium sp.]|uniref:cupin domain-containing protein n=1 Tax=Aquabacterium sp. TaxID=1872578 RepID=UPI003784BE5E